MLERGTDARSMVLVCGMGDTPLGGRRDDVLVADSGISCRGTARDLPFGAEVLIGEGVADVSPLNLAAAIKRDRRDMRVSLVASSRGGSMASRASSAGVELLDSPAEVRGRLNVRGPMTGVCPQPVPGEPIRSMTACFVSGRGGVGKSSMSVLFAMAAHRAGLRTALIDMDLQFGDLAYLCADDPLFEKIALEETCAFAGFEGLPADSIPLFHFETLPEYADASEFRFGQFLLDAKSTFDVVLMNTGTYWTDLHADIIGVCDVSVFVMDQRPASVVSCREAMELATRLGVPSSKFTFLLNRCDPREQISGYDCAFALGIDDVLQVLDGGREMEDAFALGRPSSLLGTRNPAVDSSETAACELFGRFGFPVEAPQGNAGFKVLWRRGGKTRRGE